MSRKHKILGLFLYEENKISKPSKKFHFFDKNGLNSNDNKLPEFAKIYFRTKKGTFIIFGQNMINPAIVQPSKQIKKRQQKSDPLLPSNFMILDPCPTLLTCYSCAQKKKSKSDCDEYSK